MARKHPKRHLRCVGCRYPRLDGETFYGGFCPLCRAERGRAGRAKVGARLLARAKEGDAVERDGKTFTVVVLPAKRRGGRRRRR